MWTLWRLRRGLSDQFDRAHRILPQNRRHVHDVCDVRNGLPGRSPNGRGRSMRDEYDVIVVGAGPGGSIAARTAAEECDVLLIEKRQEIGAPVRCAEGVDKRSVVKFIQPEKRWIAGDVNRARIYSPDGTMFELSEELVWRRNRLRIGAQTLRSGARKKRSTRGSIPHGAHPCNRAHHRRQRGKRR